MGLTPLKKLTLIAEALLRERLLHDLKSLGVNGYSLSRVEGDVGRGLHASDFEGNNVQIDCIVSEQMAEQVVAHLEKQYIADFPILAYLQDVQVLRNERI